MTAADIPIMTLHPPRISLCMIARDEANIIGQAISSVAPIVSEIIVVDTGSSDGTQDLVRSLGGTVIEHPWADDFSTPRNLGIQQARGEWILVLDADEAIDSSHLPTLIALASSSNTCFQLIQRHYTSDCRLSGFIPTSGEYPAWEREHQGYFDSALVRFFPNHTGIQYIGRIHELVEPWIQQQSHLRIASTEILLHHYGHTPEVLNRKSKHNLYRTVGEQKAAETPSDWKAFFELGVEYNRPGFQDQSAVAFIRSLELKKDYVPSWTNLGYVLCELKRYSEAVECLGTALTLDHASVEAHCNLGVTHMRMERFALAERHLRRAIHLMPTYVNAFMNLGITLGRLQRIPEAILIFHRVLELQPGHRGASDAIKAYYAAATKLKAQRHSHPLAPTDPSDGTTHLTPSEQQALSTTLHQSLKTSSEAIDALVDLVNHADAIETPRYRLQRCPLEYS